MARVTFTAVEVGTNASISAPVTVDGTRVGNTPVTVDVGMGKHVVGFESTQTHTSDTGSHEFEIVAGQTAGAFSGLYHKNPPVQVGPPQPPKPPQPGQPPQPPPRTSFPCPAGDATFTTRDDLRRHIFDMQSRGDPRHVNVRP
jgi:hypothetical protein